MLDGEDLYELYKDGSKLDISPLFDPDEWMCLYTYLCTENKEDVLGHLKELNVIERIGGRTEQ